MFVENVHKLIHHSVLSGAIINDAPAVAYTVSKLTATSFAVPKKPEKYYKGKYEELELRDYLDNAKEV